MNRFLLSVWLVFVALTSVAPAAEPLPNTKPLTVDGDLAAKMVAGIHKYLDRELKAAPAKRDELWKAKAKEPLAAKRERLKKILGVAEELEPSRIEKYAPYAGSDHVCDIDGCRVSRIKWSVLPNVMAEGLFIRGSGGIRTGLVIAIPHGGQKPGELAGFEFGAKDEFALALARNGCDVYIPTAIDRTDLHSANPHLKRATNLPHTEFIHRMAYEMGRTQIGYEVQTVLALTASFGELPKDLRVVVIGYGDGGRVALYAAALEPRIAICQVSGAFGPSERIWTQPLDRNLWGVSKEFGDAEIASMIAPRKLIVDPMSGPKWSGPLLGKAGRSGAAPGPLAPAPIKDVQVEFEKLKRRAGDSVKLIPEEASSVRTDPFLAELGVKKPEAGANARVLNVIGDDFREPADVVQKRLVDQRVAHVQKLWRDSDAVRKDFWKKADATTPEAWEKSCDWYREYFHSEVIGKLPEPKIPLNPRSRQVYDEKEFTGYEVVLDVYEDVFAQGILLMPKGLKPGEKRPVVVCQHGLEGTPRSCIDPEKSPTYFEFARKLVAQGYIVYCPQNPYYGQNDFRQLQRKANPLKLSLFSFIIRQHQRTLDWLETLPNVEKTKIAFYGLSYGGKTAMRVPAIEKRYCLSICSGDFNEWIGKNVSVDLDRSYMWTNEYEMVEFDLGNTFNYAEMAYLIAPRPFMVERGHDDGVGTDEMVASEFAKVRYLYANRLKLPERTTIDFQVGGHRIFLKGTLEFLEKHLGKP